MSSWGVSILFDTSYLNKKLQFLTILEATVYSETPDTSNAYDLSERKCADIFL